MKLKNKKTGEIVKSIQPLLGDGGYSIAELNEEWEDVSEEPKGYYVVTGFGSTIEFVETDLTSRLGYKSIGNYFETKEEAEKAVEKLKAWKRLKDKGFEFCGWCEDIGFRFTKSGAWQTEVEADLDLLFGGKE